MAIHRKAVFVLLASLHLAASMPMGDDARLASFLTASIPQNVKDKVAAVDSLLRLMAEVDLPSLCMAVYPPGPSPSAPLRSSNSRQADPRSLNLAAFHDYYPMDMSDYADLELSLQGDLPLTENALPVKYGLPEESAPSANVSSSQPSPTARTVVSLDATVKPAEEVSSTTYGRVEPSPVSFSALANPSETPSEKASGYAIDEDDRAAANSEAVLGTKIPALKQVVTIEETQEGSGNSSAASDAVDASGMNVASSGEETSDESLLLNPLDFASKILSDLSKLRLRSSNVSLKKGAVPPTEATKHSAPDSTRTGGDDVQDGSVEVIGVEMTKSGMDVVVKRAEDLEKAGEDGEGAIRKITRNILLNNTRALVSLASTVVGNRSEENAEASPSSAVDDREDSRDVDGGSSNNATLESFETASETNSSASANGTYEDDASNDDDEAAAAAAAAVGNATNTFGLKLKQSEISFFDKASEPSEKEAPEATESTDRKLTSLMFTTLKGLTKGRNVTDPDASVNDTKVSVQEFIKVLANNTEALVGKPITVHPTGKPKGISAVAADEVEGSGEVPNEAATNYVSVGSERVAETSDSSASIKDELASESLTLVNTVTPPSQPTASTRETEVDIATPSPVGTTTASTTSATSDAAAVHASDTVNDSTTPPSVSGSTSSSEPSSTQKPAPTAPSSSPTLVPLQEDIVPSLPDQTEQERLDSLNYALGEFNMLDSMNAIDNFNDPGPPFYKQSDLTDAERGIIEHPVLPDSHYGHGHVMSSSFDLGGGSFVPTSYPETPSPEVLDSRDPFIRPHSAATHGEYGDRRSQVATFWENYLSPEASYWGLSEEPRYTARDPSPGYYGPFRKDRAPNKRFNLPFLRALTGANQETVWSAKPQRDLLVQDYTCPGLFGYFPDVADCRVFHICSWGISYRFKCPLGTAWNQFRNVCDWDVNVNCLQTSGI